MSSVWSELVKAHGLATRNRWLSYIKAFHVIAIIAWMAGLLYLPRLFVYHAASVKGSEQSETFKVMELRLLRFITTPAMVASWVLGLILAFSGVIDWSGPTAGSTPSLCS